MAATSHSSGTRFDFRIDSAQKQTIEQAASLMGMSLTQFAKMTLVDRARELVEQHHTTALSNHDRDLFLAILDADAAPSQTLVRAAKRYKLLRVAGR